MADDRLPLRTLWAQSRRALALVGQTSPGLLAANLSLALVAGALPVSPRQTASPRGVCPARGAGMDTSTARSCRGVR